MCIRDSTRTVDVNVDKFNARYDDLADSRNMPSKRKNQPTGKKEKFNNRNNRRGQQFGRRRETEAERLPVSYTHLDVYKRQVQSGAGSVSRRVERGAGS